MSRSSPLPVPTDPSPGALPPARELIARQLVMLTRLAEVGMEVAEAAGARAKALAQGAEVQAGETDPGLTFSRAARAVRMTIALQSRLMKDLADLDAADAHLRKAEAGKRRHRAFRMLEPAVDEASGDADEAGELLWEARDRLSETEDEDFFRASPTEIVARICADLGLDAAASVALWGDEPLGGEAEDGEDASPSAPPGCGGADAAGAGPLDARSRASPPIPPLRRRH